MLIASRSTTVRAKPTELDQPNEDAAYDRSSNAAGLRAGAGEQESLLAEQRELGNNLAERKVGSAWPGKAIPCGFGSAPPHTQRLRFRRSTVKRLAIQRSTHSSKRNSTVTLRRVTRR